MIVYLCGNFFFLRLLKKPNISNKIKLAITAKKMNMSIVNIPKKGSN